MAALVRSWAVEQELLVALPGESEIVGACAPVKTGTIASSLLQGSAAARRLLARIVKEQDVRSGDAVMVL